MQESPFKINKLISRDTITLNQMTNASTYCEQ